MKNILRMVPGLLFLFSIAVAALTAGCGGGGGSAGFGANPIVITTVNAPQVSAQTFNLSGAVSGAGNQTDGTVTASSVGQNVHGLNLAVRVKGQYDRLSGEIGSRQIQSLSVKPAAASVFPCANGGSYSVNSNSSTSASITYSNCIETPGETLSGTMTFSSLIVSGNPSFPPWSVNGRLRYSNFSIDSDHVYLVDGVGNFSLGSVDGILEDLTISSATYTVSLDGESSTLSGFSFAMSANAANLDYTLSMNGTLSSSLLDGSVTFQTQTQFAGVDMENNDPESGSFKIIGANNSSVTLTAIGAGQVRLEVDADGNGVVDVDGTTTTTWGVIDATL